MRNQARQGLLAKPVLPVVVDFQRTDQIDDLAALEQEAARRPGVSLQIPDGCDLDHEKPVGCQGLNQGGKKIALEIGEAADQLPGSGRDAIRRQVQCPRPDLEPALLRLRARELEPDRRDIDRRHIQTTTHQPAGNAARSRRDIERSTTSRELDVECIEPVRLASRGMRTDGVLAVPARSIALRP